MENKKQKDVEFIHVDAKGKSYMRAIGAMKKPIRKMESGSEGDAHDLYGVCVYTYDDGFKKVVAHAGLSNWIEITEGNSDRIRTVMNYNMVQASFKNKTGMDFDEFEEAVDLEMHTCEKCGAIRDVEYQKGYPGETLIVCNVCGSVIDTIFNESAII